MWNAFSRATTMGLYSILGRGGLVTKIYFPREILPLSACITSFIMMMFELSVFVAFVIALNFIPPTSIILLPFLFLLEFVLAIGLSLPLAVLNVYYRDVQYMWSVLLYAGFFITPIFYRLEIFPENIRQFLYINPMAQIIEMAHNVALYDILPNPSSLAYTIVVTFAIFTLGYFVFRYFEFRVAEAL